MGYIDMCGPTGYGFQPFCRQFSHLAAILVINRVSIFDTLFFNLAFPEQLLLHHAILLPSALRLPLAGKINLATKALYKFMFTATVY